MSDDSHTAKEANTGANATLPRNGQPTDVTNLAIAAENQNRPKEDIGWDRWIELAFTFAILTATVVNVCVATKQWSTMVDSNQINREAFTSVQRAFVTVSSFDTPIRISNVPEQSNKQAKYWWFIPNVKNSGNTPTKNMKYFIGASCPAELSWAMAGRMTIECDFTRRDLLDPVDIFNKPPTKGNASAGILGPQSSIELGGIGINENSIQAVLKGFQMYVFGLIYYNDIFPDTKQHVTKFCYQIGANLSDANEIKSSFGFCDHWNCADDECKDDRKAWEADAASGKIQKPFEVPAGATPFNVPIPVLPPPNN